jgi:hypothetical protein
VKNKLSVGDALSELYYIDIVLLVSDTFPFCPPYD